MRRPCPVVLIYLTAVALLLAAAPGCGKKPRTRAPTPQPATATPPDGKSAGSGGPEAPDDLPPITRTAGGVQLPDAAAELISAAMSLARDPNAGSATLKAAGAPARPLVIALLGSANLNEVEAALDWLAAHPTPDAIDALVGLLGHDAVALRRAAATALNATGGPGVAAKVAKLLNDPRPVARIAAARLAGSLKLVGLRNALIKAVADPDEAVALNAAAALVSLGADAAANAAMAALAADGKSASHSVRAALSVIRRLGAATPAPVIERVMSLWDDAQAAAEAARGVARLAPADRLRLTKAARTAAHPHLRRGLIEGYLEAVDASSGAAARSLSKAATALAQALKNDPAADVRARAIDALGKLTGDVAQLTEALKDPAAAVRGAAAARLSTLGPAAIAPITDRLGAEGDAEVRRVLIFALGRLGTHRAAAEALIGRLSDKQDRPRAYLALRRLTGQDFPPQPARWRPWLEKQFQPRAKAAPLPGGKNAR